MDKANKVLEHNTNFYNETATFCDRHNSYIRKASGRRFYEKFLSKILKDRDIALSGKRVLELGCGTAPFIPFLLSEGIDSYLGIDLSESMLSLARSKTNQYDLENRCDFAKISIEDFLDKSSKARDKFDIIFSVSFLHHLYDPNKIIKEMHKILSPGGVYIGLHEVNQLARTTASKRIDDKLSYLMGYGTTDIHLGDRLARILKGLWRRMFSVHEHTVADQEDLVEYQLNTGDFSPQYFKDFFTRHPGFEGEIGEYCFYTYRFLKILKPQTQNYFFVVIKRSN